MDLILTNSNIPYLDNSRPNPLFLIPPNGTRGSEETILLTVTIPDSINLENFSALCRFRVQILAPRPNFESFAIWMASISFSNIVIGATGPNVSSYAILIFGLMLPNIVGL